MYTQPDKTKKFQRFTVFDGEQCNKIIADVTGTITPVPAQLAEQGVQTEIRRNFVYHIPRPADDKAGKFKWIYSAIAPQIKAANNLWGFEIAEVEGLQLLEYGVSNYFDWHVDGFSPNTATRKMGFSISLGKPEDYKGGDLQFWWRADKYSLEPRLEQGEMAVFPAFLLHRVSNITAGKRYNLVSWVNGKEGWR